MTEENPTLTRTAIELAGRTAIELAGRIAALPDTGSRRIVAISGPPGSGKSTLAEAIVAGLENTGHETVLMPMDGFHLDDRLLEPRGLLPRKGAPETFDFGGFFATLTRVRSEETVILPVFDRTREIAIAGAAEIRPETRIVVVEGNYLCFDEDPWRELSTLWDFSVFLDVPMDELENRLVTRWLSFGYDPETARSKVSDNDLANARRVKRALGKVDAIVAQEDASGETA